jgi:hypothetical protein
MAGNDLFSMMQDGEPLARYKKTILGKVHVTVLDEFSQEPQELILSGDYAKTSERDGTMVEIWSDKANAFFKKINRKHFEAGRLSAVEGPLPKLPESPNSISDEKLDEMLQMKFLAFKAKLDKFTDEAPVFRLLNRARELEKSDAIVGRIEEKLSEIQLSSYQSNEEE